MNELEQLKERISSLSAEELEQLKAYLATEKEEGDNAPTDPTEEQQAEESPSDEPTEEEQPIDEPTEQLPTEEELTEELPTEELSSEDVPMGKSVEQAIEQPTEENISKMQKFSDIPQEDTASSVMDEQGEELPIDYQQIIDAQSAKIMALEAENTSLKSKVDGAFGYSAKPPTPAKVNRLYDDATDVHFHK